jgi:hypothetical protein
VTRPAHPRTFGRGIRLESVAASNPTQTIVFVAQEERRRWVEGELGRARCTVQTARSVAHVVSALIEDPPPRPQVLVIDLESVAAGDLFGLHQVREQGWCGTIVALGAVSSSLRQSLKITRIITPPFVEGALGEELARHRAATEQVTTQIPRSMVNEPPESR